MRVKMKAGPIEVEIDTGRSTETIEQQDALLNKATAELNALLKAFGEAGKELFGDCDGEEDEEGEEADGRMFG